MIKTAKNCQNCGKEFETHRSIAKFCSNSCSLKFIGRKRIKSAGEKFNSTLCAICGLQIFGKQIKTCGSEWCVHEYKRIKYGTITERKERKKVTTRRTIIKYQERYKLEARDRYKNSAIVKAQQRERKHRYKARLLLATIDDSTKAKYHELLSSSQSCHWCKTALTPDIIEIDHYIPLAKGGHHSASNLVASCMKCNRSRRDMMPDEFVQRMTA
jgi:5-methylcytosine-specific restriction endonuclease McrA